MSEKSAVSLASTVHHRENHLSAQIDNETVVMSIEQGNYYGLDTIASVIWLRLESPIVVAELCTELAKEYDADAATINRDVLLLLEKLADNDLITVTP